MRCDILITASQTFNQGSKGGAAGGGGYKLESNEKTHALGASEHETACARVNGSLCMSNVMSWGQV